MSTRLQQSPNQDQSSYDKQLWRMRWFFAHLFAVALLSSIPASIVIAIITKNPLPGLIPAPLLLSIRPIIRYLFPMERNNTNESSDI